MQIEEHIDNRNGKFQILSNIKLLNTISSYLQSTLGPFGLDKLIINGDSLTCTNDGATILKNLNLKHPIAKIIENISQSQDDQIGDGTTSVVLLAIEILKSLKDSIERYEVTTIANALDKILYFCVSALYENSKKLDEMMKKDVDMTDVNKLVYIARTCLTSKIVKQSKEYFAQLVVEAIKISEDVYIQKAKGGSITDSTLFDGIVFKKCFSYAGHQQQPRQIHNAKILLTSVELEWKSERDNAELRINAVEQYDEFVNAEWKIITDKLDNIIKSGANVVFSSAPIGDYATQYFAKHNMCCAGRVDEKDMKNLALKLKTSILTSLDNIDSIGVSLGFEERQVGNDRYNFVKAKGAATLLLRGPGDEVINEVERSLHDALMVVKGNNKSKKMILTGGGSSEINLSVRLAKQSSQEKNEDVFIFMAVHHAFENFVGILANNFGIDALGTISQLVGLHKSGYFTMGVSNCENGVGDLRYDCVFEPLNLKVNILKRAFEAAKMIVLIDSTILISKG